MSEERAGLSGKFPESDRQTLGDRLRVAREYVGMKQEEVARYLVYLGPRCQISKLVSARSTRWSWPDWQSYINGRRRGLPGRAQPPIASGQPSCARCSSRSDTFVAGSTGACTLRRLSKVPC